MRNGIAGDVKGGTERKPLRSASPADYQTTPAVDGPSGTKESQSYWHGKYSGASAHMAMHAAKLTGPCSWPMGDPVCALVENAILRAVIQLEAK